MMLLKVLEEIDKYLKIKSNSSSTQLIKMEMEKLLNLNYFKSLRNLLMVDRYMIYRNEI
jgi:hypothetical protein